MKTTHKLIKFNPETRFENENIFRLSQLKPAGTKLILNRRADLIELLKLTLFDLTLKQVLIIKQVFQKSHPRDPYEREYIIVETGKNFSKYKSDKFEDYFLKRIDEDSYYQLRWFVKGIFDEINSEFAYKKQIIKNVKASDLFNLSNIFSNVFSWLLINGKGKKVKKDISLYLNEVDNNIGHLIETNPDQALELISFLKGNIFLLKNLKFEWFEKLKAIEIENKGHEFSDDYFWFDFVSSSNDSIFDFHELFDSIDSYIDYNVGSDDWGEDYDFDFH